MFPSTVPSQQQSTVLAFWSIRLTPRSMPARTQCLSPGRLSSINEVAAGCRNATRDRSRDYGLMVTDGVSPSEPRSSETASCMRD